MKSWEIEIRLFRWILCRILAICNQTNNYNDLPVKQWSMPNKRVTFLLQQEYQVGRPSLNYYFPRITEPITLRHVASRRESMQANWQQTMIRTGRGRGGSPYLIFLLLEVVRIGIQNIPPVTLVVGGLNVALHYLFDMKGWHLGVSSLCLEAYLVCSVVILV